MGRPDEVAGGPDSDRSSVSTISTPFSNRYGIRHPFACAGMAFVCDTPTLAIAVARAGGFGALAGTLLSPDTLRRRIETVRQVTDGPFHVNLLTPFPHAEQIRVCAAEQVRAVSFHWGRPEAAEIDALRSAGVDVWMQVGSVEDAVQAHDAGAVVIVVQGSEAGGHNYGCLPLTSLLPRVRDALGTDALLLGAGGIADGRTAAAALAAGADGVWVGTRMIATDEANAHEEHKRRIVAASGEDTVLTSVYGPEYPAFNPIRVIRNATVDEWNARLAEIPTDRLGMAPIGRTLFGEREVDVRPFDSISPVPETTGDFDRMPMMAGQGVGLIRSVAPAGNVIAGMMAGARAALAHPPTTSDRR